MGIFLFAIGSFCVGLRFNPVCLAPVAIHSPIHEYVKTVPDLRHGGRVLFVDPEYAAASQSAYSMAGGRTMTGFFCYEDPEIFRSVFAKFPDPERFHRLNHFSIKLDDSPTAPLISAQIPLADVIQLTVHAKKYDFSVLPVDFVCVRKVYCDNRLADNPSLKDGKIFEGWKLYRVKLNRKVPKNE